MTGTAIRRWITAGVLVTLLPSVGFGQERLRPFSLGVLPPVPLNDAGTATVAWPAGLVAACDYFAQYGPGARSTLPPDLQSSLQPDTQSGAFGAQVGLVFSPPAPPDVWTLGACAQLYAWVASRTGDAAPSRADVVRLHFALSRLGKHLEHVANADRDGTTRAAGVVLARSHIGNARTSLEHTMRGMGMLSRFSAAAFAGTPVSSVGRVVSGPAGTPPKALVEGSADTFSGSLVVETAHWGWTGEHALDASIRFRFGYEPTAVLMTSPLAPPASTLILTSLPGLAASFSGRIGLPSQRMDSEWSLVGTFGSHRLDEIVATFGQGDDAIHATLVDNGSGRWASFVELGLEAALYDNPIRVLHAEQGLVTPTITLSAGYRRDQRLSRPVTIAAGDWTGSRDRLFVRFMVDTVKQLRRRDLAADASTFDLGFGFEYDRPMARNATMTPSVTRFIIRGNINLVRAVSPTADRK